MVVSTPTLSDAVLPRSQARSLGLARDALLVIGGSTLVALLAQVSIPLQSALVALLAQVSSIPLQPVPITGQTLGVLLVGAALGWRRGALAMLAYIAEGAVGLPVFADGKVGPQVLAGPTGGYLVGFVLAAALVGWLAERGWDRRPWTMALAMALGNVAIYALGVAWLTHWLLALPALHLTSSAALRAAWDGGVVPFLPGDALKLLVAVVALPGAWWVVRRTRGQGN